VARIYLERERSQSTRGEYTSTRCGEDIPGKGEDNATRGESGPVGDRVVGCASSRIEEESDGVPRAYCVSEAAFDVVLASKDQATVQRTLKGFMRFGNAWKWNRMQPFGPM
jgi:hypothetical protein